jgi:hypothetical protein
MELEENTRKKREKHGRGLRKLIWSMGSLQQRL